MADIENLGLPMEEDDGECGYFPEKKAHTLITSTHWIKQVLQMEDFTDSQIFDNLLKIGFRRSGFTSYIDQCEGCKECIPIRVPVSKFKPSKSQLIAWKKNQDLDISIVSSLSKKTPCDRNVFATEEKAQLLREYDAYHNGSTPGYKKMTLDEAVERLEYMNGYYDGVLNMEYRLNGKLLGVGIIDYTMDFQKRMTALSSNYFYYDVSPEVRKRSIGVFSVLKEIELCLNYNIPYYYLGLYLKNCRKMNYKANYKPYELYLNDEWVEIDD